MSVMKFSKNSRRPTLAENTLQPLRGSLTLEGGDPQVANPGSRVFGLSARDYHLNERCPWVLKVFGEHGLKVF